MRFTHPDTGLGANKGTIAGARKSRITVAAHRRAKWHLGSRRRSVERLDRRRRKFMAFDLIDHRPKTLHRIAHVLGVARHVNQGVPTRQGVFQLARALLAQGPLHWVWQIAANDRHGIQRLPTQVLPNVGIHIQLVFIVGQIATNGLLFVGF